MFILPHEINVFQLKITWGFDEKYLIDSWEDYLLKYFGSYPKYWFSRSYDTIKLRGAYDKFPDFFRMGTSFIDCTHMKLYSPSK